MRQIDNWDDIEAKEPGEFRRPAPGGYIARIINVDDVEEKEYLRIEWDFDEGEYKGCNGETFNRAGFWPTPLFRSYKEAALGFFKAFKTSVELSNQGYVFDCARPGTLAGKRMGVVLGEEEYRKSDGSVGTRLYVAQVRSVEAIRKGDFKAPERKKLPGGQAPGPAGGQFQHMEDLEDDDDLPFA